MPDHDAISALFATDRGGPKYTPQALIDAFCTQRAFAHIGRAIGDADYAERKMAESSDARHLGYCGYEGKDAFGPGFDGFDDGYDMMGCLLESGWVCLPEVGEWPYVMFFVWRPRHEDERWAICSYIERDFTIELFPDQAATNRRHDEFKRRHAS
jgi:hypothetical protein